MAKYKNVVSITFLDLLDVHWLTDIKMVHQILSQNILSLPPVNWSHQINGPHIQLVSPVKSNLFYSLSSSWFPGWLILLALRINAPTSTLYIVYVSAYLAIIAWAVSHLLEVSL